LFAEQILDRDVQVGIRPKEGHPHLLEACAPVAWIGKWVLMRTSGSKMFQAATANFNPWTEAKVDTKNPDRGPLLLISGEQDHTVPWAIVNAS
jgi:hypothetical protein